MTFEWKNDMQGATTKGRSVRLAWWLLLFLTLLIGGFFVGLMTDDPQRTITHQQAGCDRVSPRKVVEGLTATAQTTGQSSPVGITAAPEGDATETAGAHSPKGDRGLVVRCQKSDGSPFPGLDVFCEVFGPNIRDEQGQLRWSFHEISTRTTSEAGTFLLEGQSTYKVHLKPPVVDQWHALAEVRAEFSMGTVSITYAPTNRFELQVQYEDGTPAAGAGCSLQDRTRGFEWHQPTTESGSSVFSKLVTDTTIELYVSSRSLRYNSYRGELTSTDIQSGRGLVILKALKHPLGRIRVEFSGFKGHSAASLLVECDPWNPFGMFYALNQGSTHWQNQFPPSPARSTKYRVTLSHPSGVFTSDWVEVLPGETTVIPATLAQGGQVKAKILDSRSKPLANAVMRIADGSYLAWDNEFGLGLQRYRDFGWTSDAEGNVALNNMPARKVTLEVEAAGKQTIVREVQVGAGSTSDLGDIVLDDAIGELLVELRGCKEGQEYVLLVSHPGGLRLSPPKPIEGSSLRMTGLPLRKYRVGAAFAKGGSDIVWIDVDLSLGAAQQIVTLDVSTITEAPKQR